MSKRHSTFFVWAKHTLEKVLRRLKAFCERRQHCQNWLDFNWFPILYFILIK